MELKGIKSYYALTTFNCVVLRITQLPNFEQWSEEQILESFEQLTQEQVTALLRKSIDLIPLNDKEILSLIVFCEDKNGVPLGLHSLKNFNPYEIRELCLSVLIEISKIRINFVTDDEIRRLPFFGIDMREIFSKHKDITLDDALNFALYEGLKNGI